MSLPELTSQPKHHPDCCLSLSTRLLDVLTAIFAPETEQGAGARLVLSVGSGTGLLEALLLARWSNPDPEHPSGAGMHDGEPLVPVVTTTAMTIKGIEVRPSINKYLPEANLGIVRGTWDVVSVSASIPQSISSDPEKQRSDAGADRDDGDADMDSNAASAHDDAAPVAGLLFVYPRSPALVSRYLRDFAAAWVETEVEEAQRGMADCQGAAVWLGHRSDWPDFAPCFESVPGLGAVEILAADDDGDPGAGGNGVDPGLVGYEMMAVARRWGGPTCVPRQSIST